MKYCKKTYVLPFVVISVSCYDKTVLVNKISATSQRFSQISKRPLEKYEMITIELRSFNLTGDLQSKQNPVPVCSYCFCSLIEISQRFLNGKYIADKNLQSLTRSGTQRFKSNIKPALSLANRKKWLFRKTNLNDFLQLKSWYLNRQHERVGVAL